MSPNRDVEQFTSWLEEHQGIIQKVAGTFTQSAQDREDLVQEILLRIWSAMPSFRGESKVSTWIYRIALNRALTWNRATRQPMGALPPHLEPVSQVCREAAEDREIVEQLYEAVRPLEEIDRSLILLALDGHTYQEMAEVMGMTVNHVGVRLNRARKRLAEQLRLDG